MTRLSDALSRLNAVDVHDWADISVLLAELQASSTTSRPDWNSFRNNIAGGIAFLTFDFGIDGVSIEIAKYAKALEGLFPEHKDHLIHVIGGDFHPQADSVLQPGWNRYHIPGINGWSKWDGGKWFAGLFYEDMPTGSPESQALAKEIMRQALHIAEQLGSYIERNNIALLIPVNIHSNPGNLALALASVIVTEILNMAVINSNHDFYWEGGKPARERTEGEPPGVRDHFFRNVGNQDFFSLLTKLYPWKSPRWLQVNINRLQSNRLVESFGFSRNEVAELSTSISDTFLKPYTKDDVRHARVRMAHILSNGQSELDTTAIQDHLANLSSWMKDQHPCVLGLRAGLRVDPESPELLILLQPTRVIARKRIEKDVQLIRALLDYPPFRTSFETNADMQLMLHITGPTPIEHQADLEVVLHAFQDLLQAAPPDIVERLFLTFSVGTETHPSFEEKSFKPLTIETIYHIASAVVFPSQTEGRGLPIVEASASRIPLICSIYEPAEVFADVVGEGLPEEEQIRYTLFPEDGYPESFLDDVTRLLLHPEDIQERLDHNYRAVSLRYRTEAMTRTFDNLIQELWENM